ncbi:unnamed protein product [Prunus armeniaca]
MWKEGKDSILKEGVPAKVVWYFPPIPMFKRMFRSHETAKSLTWHTARKSIDGQMSHLADSPSWKLLYDKWPEFGNEPRNLRLALSYDGFNPHSSLNVYLEPLIDDLKSLWDGIGVVYDAHNGEYFTLRAALMWTINDFPTYGNLSGCVVKGYKACPICGDDTPSHRLKNGHKICYIGHRKWLPINHPYRRQRVAFNGKPEYGTPPEPLTGEEVLHMVEDGDRICWKKKSIFFDLKYWKYLPVRHVLDVMHIEKNVCDSIISTLLEIPGKNKDGIAARLDLLNMGVKTDLQPEYGERRTRFPPRPWNLSRAEKREVCNSFYGMKVPEDFLALNHMIHLNATIAPCGNSFCFGEACKNRTRPEGCIAERYIAEEAVEFCTEHLSNVSTVGMPSSQKMGVSKPLSSCTVSVVDRYLLNQAHLYVLENTEEVLPYIEYVQSELHEEDNHGVSKNLRWLAAGPNMAVPSYWSYLIKDLTKIGHRNDQFVLASQVKQVFFVDDPMHRGWSVVLSMPNGEYNDVIGDDVLGDVRIECEPFTRGMPNVDTFDELVGEFGSQNIRDGCEDIWIE